MSFGILSVILHTDPDPTFSTGIQFWILGSGSASLAIIRCIPYKYKLCTVYSTGCVQYRHVCCSYAGSLLYPLPAGPVHVPSLPGGLTVLHPEEERYPHSSVSIHDLFYETYPGATEISAVWYWDESKRYFSRCFTLFCAMAISTCLYWLVLYFV